MNKTSTDIPVITTNGLGTSRRNLRAFAPSEVVMITLERKPQCLLLFYFRKQHACLFPVAYIFRFILKLAFFHQGNTDKDKEQCID